MSHAHATNAPPTIIVPHHKCPAAAALPPIRYRSDLGALLRQLGLTGAGAELGVQRGIFSAELLRGWQTCSEFVQVDVWAPLENYDDVANVAQQRQQTFREDAEKALQAMVQAGYAKRGVQCHNFTVSCASQYPDNHFDFVYVDARHDRLGVLADLTAWWPKLRGGGVMAGHDYTEQTEPGVRPGAAKRVWDPTRKKENWTLNFDGTVDRSARAVKGAVDDFFGGVARGRYGSPRELRRCPRQVMVTYRENAWNTWVVAKPVGTAYS